MHAMQYYDIVGTAESDFGVQAAVVGDQICSKACPNMCCTSLTQISPTSYVEAIHLPSPVHGSKLEKKYETINASRNITSYSCMALTELGEGQRKGRQSEHLRSHAKPCKGALACTSSGLFWSESL